MKQSKFDSVYPEYRMQLGASTWCQFRSTASFLQVRIEYISHARMVYNEGYRNAYLGEVETPVVYGVQGKLRE